MAQQQIRRPKTIKSGGLVVSLTIGGRQRTLALGPWLAGAILVALPALGVWYLGATLYLVFHDQLLASLIARETDAQYAYEDRIAGLSTQLDRETSRALVDRHTLETTVSTLEERSVRLAARATLLDRLVAHTMQTTAAEPKSKMPRVGSTNPLLAPGPAATLPAEASAYAAGASDRGRGAAQTAAPGLRLRGDTLDGPGPQTPGQRLPDDRASVETPTAARIAALAATFATIEDSQAHIIATLREPMLAEIAKMRTALADVGVSPGAALGGRTSDVGGPFVPLPVGLSGFDQNAALLQDAVLQADRLTALVEKVPLRKPLPGQLEVTSTFGPRIDPFLGRAALHTGIDFREPYGESVHATAAGIVSVAASEGGYGTMVEIDHGNGLSTRYAHLSSVSVAPGQKIESGTIVGHVGSSGRATGPHLHYETRINGEAVDPTRFLKVGAKLFGDS